MPADLLEAEAQRGDRFAQNELGRRYGLGKGVPKDSARSFSLYEKSATQGLCDAQTNLGFMYMNGEGVGKDLGQARHWYSRAADQGNARAAYSLGYIAAVMDKDGQAAEKWWLMAAEAGYLPAQRSLATLYQAGDIHPKDDKAAILWLRRVRDATLFGKVWRKE